ncbi:phosphatase PAP2 family protein [Fibrivirga algicola]|nr:phosphatase PAP2 family protein [Fibrivirga algicola]
MNFSLMLKPRHCWHSRLLWVLVFTGWTLQSSAQSDSLPNGSPYRAPRLSIARLVFPSAFIGTGLYTLSDNHAFNRFRVRGEIQDHVNGYRTHLDDYLAYGPSALLAGLTVAGVKGRSTPFDQAGLWVTANAIAGAITFGLKRTTGYVRPDGSNNQSFPSGHTSFAFAGAGVLDREFGQANVLIPIAGYAMAGTTGYLRMVNDKHWISDVLVGAGIGLLSAEAAYHVYPWVKRKLTRHRNRHKLSN